MPEALIWTYNPDLPSFRHRIRPALPHLEAAGWRIRIDRVERKRYGTRLLDRRRDLARADLLILAKINLAIGEAVMLRRLAPTTVFDFDDALFLAQPSRLGGRPHPSPVRRWKFGTTIRSARRVIAGNAFLAAGARRYGAGDIEVVPTPVELPSMNDAPRRDGHTLVWIGRPENLVYLELIRPALVTLAQRHHGLRLRIISSRFPDWPDVPIERVHWSPETERSGLLSADIGVMPLTHDSWAQGKCAFKLLQYMAAGLPSVATPVGMSRDVVIDGVTGRWAGDLGAWVAAIEELLTHPERRAAWGAAARASAEKRWSRRVIAPRMAAAITAAVAA
ncbi:MAG: glycosyltransferase [Acidobacteriota bacterium]